MVFVIFCTSFAGSYKIEADIVSEKVNDIEIYCYDIKTHSINKLSQLELCNRNDPFKDSVNATQNSNILTSPQYIPEHLSNESLQPANARGHFSCALLLLLIYKYHLAA